MFYWRDIPSFYVESNLHKINDNIMLMACLPANMLHNSSNVRLPGRLNTEPSPSYFSAQCSLWTYE